MKKALLIFALVLGAVVAAVLGVGYALPIDHTASGAATVTLPPDRVFATILDVQNHPKWRDDVDAVEVLSPSPLRWREHSGGDAITFEIVSQEPPRRIVSRIADDSLPFGGTWTYALQPDGAGTRVTITENGQVFNPFFRFMSRFVFGHTATIDQFLADLTRVSSSGR